MRSHLIQFLSNMAFMASSIYIPLYAQAVGASHAQIGWIGASYGFSIFASSYLFSRLADAKDRRIFVRLGLVASVGTFLLPMISRTPLHLMVARGVAGFALGIFIAPLIAYTHDAGGKLGVFSAYGALGFAFAGLIGGMIARTGEIHGPGLSLLPYWSVFLLSSFLFLLAALLACRLPRVEVKPIHVSLLPLSLIQRNLRLYLAVFLRHLGAFSFWIVFPLYLTDLGASKFWIGGIYFLNAGGQYLVMRRIEGGGEVRRIRRGLLLSMLVFFLYTRAWTFYVVMPIQLLLATSFSLLYVGSLHYLTARNEEKATAVGILSSFMSISMAVGPLIGGTLSQMWGYDAVLYSAMALTAGGLLLLREEV
jgi:MFS family permease